MDGIRPSPASSSASAPTRRSLLALGLATGAGLLAGGTARAQAALVAAASPGTPVYAAEGAAVLDPIALAILHHARGDAGWSSRARLRAYLKNGNPSSGLFGLDSLNASAALQLSPQARDIAAAWQQLLATSNVFQRSKNFQQLVARVDAYAARVLNAERYYLPLNSQGFLSYDYLDQELVNDAGLVEAGSRFAATRFATLDHGSVGALQLMNLHVQQLSPSLKAPAELHRVPVADADLAERLLSGKASTLQLLEVQLRGATPKCFPHAEPLRGTLRPLPALAVAFVVVDAGSGATLYSQPIAHELRQGRQGYCAVA